MSNLIERLTLAESEDKIPVHPFVAALNEFRKSKVRAAEIKSFFNLTTAQATQARALIDLWAACPDGMEFERVLKNMLYMGENGIHSRYQNITYFNSRLSDEIIDQGGTLP